MISIELVNKPAGAQYLLEAVLLWLGLRSTSALEETLKRPLVSPLLPGYFLPNYQLINFLGSKKRHNVRLMFVYWVWLVAWMFHAVPTTPTLGT